MEYLKILAEFSNKDPRKTKYGLVLTFANGQCRYWIFYVL